ncbi:zinc finger protein BALDIBIS-like [Gastrolobium bilobum]|uniref:zinc finger protein BALDIBIS-like n=1 Tax=Gastrolobium bilobum TaxID=150636 RepID=UPI002AB1AA26|nr:zinc finger protein BALDIBIS-like [Gastrolobium bilobum]
MMSEETISVPSNLKVAMVEIHDPNSNPNPNPNSSSAKRKRSLPGTPDPDAEVIALSPNSLMATNRFLCEVCNKGFQRDQNLQLHRRGHNLPWKLRQRTNQDVKKKVYVCPEKSCVHHDPFRALGDLTGIKKHYSRKHGEKKWKCHKCSKKYAVQSDWKAHSKICGTREYKCHCGTIFSRKDSFVTHRAFCEALVEQSARMTSLPSVLINAQTPRNPHGLLGLGPEVPLMGNLPLWLDQANPQLHHPLSFPSNTSACTFPDLVQTSNMFGSSPQAQWLMNYRYQEASSFTSGNLSMPQGLKLEQEENKGDLSHSVSSLYSSNIQNPQGGPIHMSATPFLHKASQVESTRINNIDHIAFNNNSNNVFGLFGSNLSSTSCSNNRNNVVEIQKIFKQANQAEIFNDMVNQNPHVSTHNGGGFSLNDSNSSSFVIENGTKNEDQLGLTRDFLGVRDESLSRPFLQQELAKFNIPIGSFMNLQSQFGGHY